MFNLMEKITSIEVFTSVSEITLLMCMLFIQRRASRRQITSAYLTKEILVKFKDCPPMNSPELSRIIIPRLMRWVFVLMETKCYTSCNSWEVFSRFQFASACFLCLRACRLFCLTASQLHMKSIIEYITLCGGQEFAFHTMTFLERQSP